MTIEEKARAYDEALERARKIHSEIVNNELLGFPGQIEDIFPQLRESEDERIRKELINFLRSPFIKENLTDEKVAPWIAYLEKQKEQKHPNGCFTCDEYKKGYEEGRRNGFTAGYNKAMKEVEQKEPENTSASTMVPSCWEVEQKEQKPAEWSEEDRLHYVNVLEALEYVKGCKSDYDKVESVKSDIAWLKSLRPQSHWKPTEEQIDRLFSIVAALRKDYCDDMADFLAELRNDLKSLGVEEEPEYYQHFDPNC